MTNDCFYDHNFELTVFLMYFFTSREKQALARGELKDENNLSAKTKKKKTLRRIHEWQRFEANCQLVRDLDEEQLSKISEMHKQSRQSTPVLKPKKGKEKASWY